MFASLLSLCLSVMMPSCSSSGAANGGSASDEPAFEYRGLYMYSSQTKQQLKALDAQNPDYDWQLWGHNIRKAVGDKEAFYATVGGKKTKEQYCFSSEELYQALKGYVAETMNRTSIKENHYTIMPNDNWLVCECAKCKELGCAPKNATPAITAFITRLAEEFPNVQFFTSSYNTSGVPEDKLPENVGVFISASTIQLRSNFKESKGFKEFDELLDQWKDKTDLIYIWDYCRNFDDYFTPFPCVEALRAHFLYYQEKGVKGVFINGSCPNYSTFDDLQTYVIAKLMKNPAQDTEPLVNEFLGKHYKKTAPIIADYYLYLEDKVKKACNYLPIYGAFDEAMLYYLSMEDLEAFRAELEKASKKVEGEERKKLNILLTALNFSRMQHMRENPKAYNQQTAEDAYEVMKGGLEAKELQNYKETNGKLSDYLDEWKRKVLSKY